MLIILSMLRMSDLAGGEESLGLELRSREEGEAQEGGETGGGEAAPLLLLGVRLLKAEGPEGEMEAGWVAGETRE